MGVVAHVDAGKTSLTERLLFETGVLERLGRVDDGDTQTDTMALERERGITIRSAVATFAWRDAVVNLLDTPGHSDFVAEVERALLEHPLVREATVVAQPDARVGEVPVAFVVAQGADVDVEELRAHARDRLGRLKRPEVIHLVAFDDLPRNALGKVQKAELRRLLAEPGARRWSTGMVTSP